MIYVIYSLEKIAEEAMLKTYRTVEQAGQDEIVIEKSIFIGYARPVASEEEAQAFIQEIRKKHRDIKNGGCGCGCSGCSGKNSCGSRTKGK